MTDKNENKKDPITNEILTEHEYDGIKELDNPLPKWWVQLFYLCIIFSAVYVYYYHVQDGTSIDKEYKQSMNEHQTQHFKNSNESDNLDSLIENSNKPEVLALGKTHFESKCVSCHGKHGEGGIGPNLTDSYWIHGKGDLISIITTIKQGVPAMGMPPWGAILKKDELDAVTSFVYHLKGTNPANPKSPQGNKIE